MMKILVIMSPTPTSKPKIDVSTCAKATRDAAQIFYRRYCENADNKNFLGQECPKWLELTPSVKSHWCAVAILASNAAMATIREYADMRLSHMGSRPLMFASTKESFGVQLIMAAELVLRTMPEMASGQSATSDLSYLLYGPTCIVPQEPIDEAWAKKSVDLTKKFIEDRCPR